MSMIASISSEGDPSVGLWGFSTTVDLGMPFDDDEIREDVRTKLRETFAHIWDDGRVTVFFQDEEFDECGALIRKQPAA